MWEGWNEGRAKGAPGRWRGSVLRKRPRGRPRIVNIPCPRCRADALRCTATREFGALRVRYYRCALCGHRGVFISGARKDWWKDSARPSSQCG